jgi:PTS system galactitol-specific IIA component
MPSQKSVFREELVLMNYFAHDAEDVLRALADRLWQDGAVKESYYAAMLARERAYPTGLPMEGLKVAIPHAEVEHVNYSAFAIATLAVPVKFGEMGGEPDSLLDISIVMMLANANPEEQVKTLRKMVDLFDEPSSIEAIMAASSPTEIVHILREGYDQ